MARFPIRELAIKNWAFVALRVGLVFAILSVLINSCLLSIDSFDVLHDKLFVLWFVLGHLEVANQLVPKYHGVHMLVTVPAIVPILVAVQEYLPTTRSWYVEFVAQDSSQYQLLVVWINDIVIILF